MILNLFYTLLTQTGRTIGSLNPNGVLKKELSVFCSFVFFLVITPSQSHASNQANGFLAFSAAKHNEHSPSCKKIRGKGNGILHLLGKWDTEI